MHPQVQKYIDEKEAEKLKKKNDYLIKLGLCEVVYSPDGSSQNNEYPMFDNRSYCKKIPYPVSDGEYKLIQSYGKAEVEKNKITSMLQIISALIFMVAFIAGFIFLEESLVLAFIYWISGFITGTLFLAIAEIIKLLHEINLK